MNIVENENGKPKVKRKLKRKVKILGVVMIVMLVFFLVGGFILDRRNNFVFSKELSTPVLSVAENEITLSEFCYYIYIVEEEVQEKAFLYNPDNTLEYWNLHFSAGTNSSFMKDMAKDTAYDACISDFVYAELASEEEHQLTEEMSEKARNDAKEFFLRLSKEQLEKTGLTLNSLEKIFMRRQIAKDYAIHYAVQYTKMKQIQNPNEEFTKEQILKELSPGGLYYEQVLKQQYMIDLNQFVYENLPMGRITVNQ